jgi:hypothetical protein
MTKLTEAERKEFARVAQGPRCAEPKPERMSAAAYVAFATFASRLDRSVKPVRFSGAQWKL